jgi:hypothetical protein
MVSKAQLFLAAYLNQNRPVSQLSRMYVDIVNPFDFASMVSGLLYFR